MAKTASSCHHEFHAHRGVQPMTDVISQTPVGHDKIGARAIILTGATGTISESFIDKWAVGVILTYGSSV